MNKVISLCACFVLILAFAQCSRKERVAVDLPPFPDALTAEHAGARELLRSQPVEVPRLFEPREWGLVQTGRRTLALIGRGIENGTLDREELSLLGEMADYMLAFQYEEDEDFLLAGAALALVGLIQSEPDSLDHRYCYGLSRMWYPWPGWENAPGLHRQLVGYVLDAAVARGLPLLTEMLQYYEQKVTDSSSRA